MTEARRKWNQAEREARATAAAFGAEGLRKRRRTAPEPARRVVTTEHMEQVALFSWAAVQAHQWPELALMFAIPNGGHRHISVARRLKAEGVKRGVPDIFLPVLAEGRRYYGLFIELKVKPNKPTKDQLSWLERSTKLVIAAKVRYSADEARNVICEYLGRLPAWDIAGNALPMRREHDE